MRMMRMNSIIKRIDLGEVEIEHDGNIIKLPTELILHVADEILERIGDLTPKRMESFLSYLKENYEV